MDEKLNSLQKKRSQLSEVLVLLNVLLGVLAIVLFISLKVGSNPRTQLIVAGISGVSILIDTYFIWKTSKKSDLIDVYIFNLINNYLKEKGNFRFVKKDYLSDGQFYMNNFLNKTSGNKFKCSDTLVGSNFSSSFVNVHYVVRSGKHSRTVTLFNGRYYEIDININIKGKIIIKEERDLLNTVPKGFIEVNFESIDFDRKFNVYCNFEEEAFRRIKPQQILGIMKLEQFREGILFITISSYKLSIGYFSNDKYYSAKDLTSIESIDRIIDNEVNVVNTFLKHIE